MVNCFVDNEFFFYDGFLYVNGEFYVGYVLNKIFKDMINWVKV